MKFMHEPLYLIYAIVIACVLGISCQPKAEYEKDTDYYNHTLYEPTAQEIEQANQEWKAEHGDYQTPLTPEHEAEIREWLAKGGNHGHL